MYVRCDGSLNSDKEKILIDLININMNLDSCDVPLTKYGIVQNFSKDNLDDTLLVLKLMVLDFLDENMLTELSLGKVEYIKNKFIINFNYKNKLISVTI